MNKDEAVIQGAFLSANRVSSLSSLQKSDWHRVGRSVLEALEEISGPKEEKKKSLVCAVWLKVLSAEAEEDIEVAWRESPFFPLQNGFPELNRAVLLELVRSTASADIYTRLLLCFPLSQLCFELERLVQHISGSPIREEDVGLFFDVWWELWRSRDVQKDSEEEVFTKEVVRLSSKSNSVSQQPAKRLKLDTTDLQTSTSPAGDVLHILLYALKDLRDRVTTAELGFRALSISLDAFYSSFLIDTSVIPPAEEKLQILSKVAMIKKKHNEKVSPEVLQDSLRDLQASRVPSQFTPIRLELDEALGIITDLIAFWLKGDILKVEDSSNPSYFAFRLKLSLQNVIATLAKTSETVDYTTLKKLTELLCFSDVEITPELSANITMTVISNQMDDYQNFALLFAGEKSWATCDDSWVDFLEKNQSAFQQQNALIQLTSSIMSKFNSGSVNVTQCKKLIKVTADIFSRLSLDDKNKALAAMMGISTRGFWGSSVPSAVTTSFEQELNMAFNCIIQGRGGASASPQGNLNTAVSLVARVVFQNPEAAVRAVCNSAISNKGAFCLMAKILQQLPGLTVGDEGLLCRCVRDVIRTKQLSNSEMEQLVKFLSLLMQPIVMVEEEGKREGFLSPQRVVNVFVLPNLSFKVSPGKSCVDFEVSLQLLHSALCVDLQDSPHSSHWAMHCSPFPLLFVLAQLYNQALRRWEQPTVCSRVPLWSMETQELLATVLFDLGQVVGAEVAADPDSWSRALFWLYNKIEELDWTVRFLLKPVWGEHFKNEVPGSLFAVCDLPEQEWSGLDLPQYGPGTGLLAWTESCCISDSLQSTMLSCLSLDQSKPEHVNMFSKGLLVALTQTLPSCSLSQWSRLLRALRTLINSGRLHVPFSLEYIDYLPLLDLRKFSYELRLSVLLLRVFQLLCGLSCSHWLSQDGWRHVGTLHAYAVRDMIGSLKTKLPPSSSAKAPVLPKIAEKSQTADVLEVERAPSQEVLFVLSQIFCHVQHVQVMLPEGQCEQLFLSSLEILSHYETIMGAFPESSSALESDNTRHFFSTITDNLQNQEMKAVLKQKIAQLVTSAA